MKYYEGERSCIHFVNNDEKVISKLVMWEGKRSRGWSLEVKKSRDPVVKKLMKSRVH